MKLTVIVKIFLLSQACLLLGLATQNKYKVSEVRLSVSGERSTCPIVSWREEVIQWREQVLELCFSTGVGEVTGRTPLSMNVGSGRHMRAFLHCQASQITL